jgi:hypothetical protein
MGRWQVITDRFRVSNTGGKNVLELNSGVDKQLFGIEPKLLNYTLKSMHFMIYEWYLNKAVI